MELSADADDERTNTRRSVYMAEGKISLGVFSYLYINYTPTLPQN